MKLNFRHIFSHVITAALWLFGVIPLHASWQPPVTVFDPIFRSVDSGVVLRVTPQGNTIAIWDQIVQKLSIIRKPFEFILY